MTASLTRTSRHSVTLAVTYVELQELIQPFEEAQRSGRAEIAPIRFDRRIVTQQAAADHETTLVIEVAPTDPTIVEENGAAILRVNEETLEVFIAEFWHCVALGAVLDPELCTTLTTPGWPDDSSFILELVHQ